MKRSHARLKPGFKASVRPGGVLELLVYEDIGENTWTGEGVTAKTVKQQIDAAGAYSRISLRINSPGGDAFEGVAIGNLLKSTGKPIDVVVDGIAASAASIIAMCGDTVTMANNAMMMIHKAWTWDAGNADEFRKRADTLDKIDGAIAQTFVDRTGKPLEEVTALMKDETWMSAADCVKEGFATAIGNDTGDDAMNMARRFKALKRYQKTPKSLANDGAMECECECPACIEGNCDACTMLGCPDQNCEDCPMQAGNGNAVGFRPEAAAPPAAVEQPAPLAESNLSLIQAKQWMLEHGIKNPQPAQPA